MHISGLELVLLANAAYVFILASYLMRDILLLRTFAVIATMGIVPYYLLQPDPLWTCIAWNVAFAAINIFWIVRLLLERRPVHFSPEEKQIYDSSLRSLKPRHARALFEHAAWKTIQPGELVVTDGQPLNALSVIVAGKFTIEKDGVIVDEIGEGRFIGSYTFLKNIKNSPARVTYTAVEASRLVVWDNNRLRDLIDDDPEISMAVEATLGLELAQRLDHSRDDLEFALRVDHVAKT